MNEEEPYIKRHIVYDGKEYVENHHGSIAEFHDTPPGSKRILMSGKFALVAYDNRLSKSEYRLVLLGFRPENRQMVFDVLNGDPIRASKPVKLWLLQDYPGGAKDWGVG